MTPTVRVISSCVSVCIYNCKTSSDYNENHTYKIMKNGSNDNNEELIN